MGDEASPDAQAGAVQAGVETGHTQDSHKVEVVQKPTEHDKTMNKSDAIDKSEAPATGTVPERKPSDSQSSGTARASVPLNDTEEAQAGTRTPKAAFSRTQSSAADVHSYFIGPRDLDHHSKWPVFLRLHGSILPEMVLPLLFVAGWATCIRCISQFVTKLVVNPVLLTVLGFVVGLGLSFRSSTAYERYNEGRKYWSQLMLSGQALGRVIWIHGVEREGEAGKDDVLHKLTGLNLIVAFSVALKHKLRWEPYTMYEDLDGLTGHLDLFAREATLADAPVEKKPGILKSWGEYLGVSFAESNPMKLVKKSSKPLGNAPLEILSYLASYIDDLVANGQLKVPMQQTLAYNNIGALNDVLTGTDRILRTPLPIAYTIAISQITWVYIVMLPFQLDNTLKWVMIPACVIAAYIILGILLIGREIENPFGHDVNDLPLDAYCQQLASDLDVICARKKPSIADVVSHAQNKVFFPMSELGYPVWASKTEGTIREELRFKTEMLFNALRDADHEAPELAKERKTWDANV